MTETAEDDHFAIADAQHSDIENRLLEEFRAGHCTFQKGGEIGDDGLGGVLEWLSAVLMFLGNHPRFSDERGLGEPGRYIFAVLNELNATGIVRPVLRSRKNPGNAHDSDITKFKAHCLVLSELMRDSGDAQQRHIDAVVWEQAKEAAHLLGIKQGTKSSRNVIESWRTARERADPNGGMRSCNVRSLELAVANVKIELHPWFAYQIFPSLADDPHVRIPPRPDPGPLIARLVQRVSLGAYPHLSRGAT